MKRVNYLLAAFAFVASFAFSSCDNPSIEPVKPTPEVEPVDPATLPYSLEVLSNVPVSFKVDGVIYSGDAFIITSDKKAGDKVTVSASAPAAYLANEVTRTVTLGAQKTVKVKFTFSRKPAAIALPATGGTVEGQDASIKVSGKAIATAVANGMDANAGFSVAVVPDVPATQVAPEASPAAAVTSTVGVVCEPDGADFGDQKVTITIPSKANADIEVECVHEKTGEKVPVSLGSSAITAQVSHFSVWNFILKGKYSSATKGEEVITSDFVNVVPGSNYVNVNPKYGYTVKRNGSSTLNALVKNEIYGRFGEPATAPIGNNGKPIPTVLELNATSAGSVDFDVVQDVVKYTFTTGKSVHDITVYGECRLVVKNVTSENRTHNGGSGR